MILQLLQFIQLMPTILKIYLLFLAAQFLLFKCNGFGMRLFKNQTKCFYSMLIPSSTLQIRFGFPRQFKANCKFVLTVDYQDMQNSSIKQQQNKQLYKNEYNQTFFCQDKNPGEMTVLKYAHKSDFELGNHRICVHNLNDYGTNKTLFQLKIIVKQAVSKPNSKSKDYQDGSLIFSTEVQELDQIANAINQKISWCKNYTNQAVQIGDRLQAVLREKGEINEQMAKIQIGILVIYGIGWVFVAKHALG